MDTNNLPPTITLDEMNNAIVRSGYLIEQRVEPIFANQGYYVVTNPAFRDLVTGKSREYDIFAMTAIDIYKDSENFIFPIILCECMNNYQPLVFFMTKPIIAFMFSEDLKCSGLPIKFFQRGNYINLSDFTIMEKYHHYNKGPFATQYCTFTKKNKKSGWIAYHAEDQNDSINSLIQALEHNIELHYDKWVIDEENLDEDVNIQIYYPLIILQGKLFGATLSTNGLDLQEIDLVQYRREIIIPGRGDIETYQIDVIKESYLPEYLGILEREFKLMVKYFRRKRHIVRKSITKIVEQAISEKPKSYRTIFEIGNE